MELIRLITKKCAGYKLRRHIRKCIEKYGIPETIYVDMPTMISKADSSKQQRNHYLVQEH